MEQTLRKQLCQIQTYELSNVISIVRQNTAVVQQAASDQRWTSVDGLILY
jgi:hypothetical protein